MSRGFTTLFRSVRPSCKAYSDTKEAKAKGFYECQETPHFNPLKAKIRFVHPENVFWNMDRSAKSDVIMNKAGKVIGNVLMFVPRVIGAIAVGAAEASYM